ncbi:MAG TPA: hypothetical protein VNN62_11480 [Methylomirabilota bacterium]|nr:hypothetical protein [Methylomirabilota bacterium]
MARLLRCIISKNNEQMMQAEDDLEEWQAAEELLAHWRAVEADLRHAAAA